MKKYYSILSSLITGIVIFISVKLNIMVKEYIHTTFKSINGFIMMALILFIVGIFISWNIWMLHKKESSILSVITSMLMVIILFLAMYMKFLDGFSYPILLLGLYTFILVIKLISRKK